MKIRCSNTLPPFLVYSYQNTSNWIPTWRFRTFFWVYKLILYRYNRPYLIYCLCWKNCFYTKTKDFHFLYNHLNSLSNTKHCRVFCNKGQNHFFFSYNLWKVIWLRKQKHCHPLVSQWLRYGNMLQTSVVKIQFY